MQNLKNNIWSFLEFPKSNLALGFKYFIIVLILLSSILLIIDLVFKPQLFIQYKFELFIFDFVILSIFLIEFVLRVLTSPNKLDFIKDKFNWIDFLAILPIFFGDSNLLLLRLMRLLRILRLLKIFSQINVFEIFTFKNTIIGRIIPIVLGLVFLKLLVLILEYKNWWINTELNLTLLFTIVGFTLGIILSNKIRVTYGKYLSLMDSIYSLQGKLGSISRFVNSLDNSNIGSKISSKWLREFIHIIEKQKDNKAIMHTKKINDIFFNEIDQVFKKYSSPLAPFSVIITGFFSDSTFITSKRVGLVPKEYTRLLEQLIYMYLILLIVFISGISGLISVFIASLLLITLFYLTDEFDYLGNNKFNYSFINLDSQTLKNYLKELEKD